MPKAYDAFISYSHAADARLATALEQGLERLAHPWNRLRAMSVFRDETDLTLNPDLWGMISGRLDRSAYLVLLMCPESAASPWVNKEVAHWCDSHGVDHVLARGLEPVGEARVLERGPLSDHAPVLVELHL